MTFDTFLSAGLRAPAERRKMPYGFSLAVHGGLLALGILYSIGRVEELAPPPPPPPTLVTFAAPSGGTPPAPAQTKKSTPRVRPRRAALVQPRPQVAPPIEIPSTQDTGETDPNAPEGPPGPGTGIGTEDGPGTGGEPGHFVNPRVARGQLAIDPHADPYRVKLPPILARARMSLWALVRICVDQNGRVTGVKILKGADPALDPSIVSVLSTWRYRPYAIDGRPVPFCSNLRYEISVP